MEIKEFRLEFTEKLREVYLESRVSSFTWLDTGSYRLADFDRDTEGEKIWVAFDAGEIAGFISLWEPDGFVHHLYVSASHHNLGIGTKLLEVAKSMYPTLSLKCMVKNSKAVNFYESNGFTKNSTNSDGFGEFYLMEFRTET